MLPARLAFLCGFLLLLSGQARADTCTLITELETGRVLRQEGDCDRRSSPASTFKIALSLMGYDAGILVDEDSPAWPYRDEYQTWNQAWKETTTPRLWLRDSVVWYSQVLTRRMGEDRFRQYMDALAYGNRDISGDRGKGNGLTHAWLSSSLQISPREQIAFLSRLLRGELPVSARAHEMTRRTMPSFPVMSAWGVYGKTGSGYQRAQSGPINRDRQFGWFVGWAQRGNRTIMFARLIRDERRENSIASFRARDSLLAELPALLADRKP